MEMKKDPIKSAALVVFVFIAIFAVTGGIEPWLGRSLLGPDGRFGLWESDIWSSENSQRFADPYSFSHIIHGMLFYAGLWVVARKMPVRYRPSPPVTAIFAGSNS